MIKFPKMHIAESVVNRILNAADDVAPAAPDEMPMEPAVPVPQGEALDAALATPPAEMPPLEDNPEGDTANALEPILHGGTALDGLLDTISGA